MSDSESDAPEEVTAQQGLQQFEEISQAQKESKARAVREGKERRRKWAEKLTPRPRQLDESVEGVVETVESQPKKEAQDKRGMLPDDIVKLIAAQEKKVFSSDSEEDESQDKLRSKKKKQKKSRNGPIILKEIPPAQCLQSSLEFINKRRMQVPRSSAVLKNLKQAPRLVSSKGLLSRK
ncbi:hypothetical protein Leryth_013652 [Lithospermum erythrorhizon]|nr:hypothetical protein Leryth_013652 [Lithospermum erythrorhizon]